MSVKGASSYKELEKKEKKEKTGQGRHVVDNPTTLEELNTNIELYKKKLTGEDTVEQKAILNKINLWKKAKQQIEMVQMAAERPMSLDTLQDIDDEISYQRKLRQNATAEDIAGIDKEIARLEEMKAVMERPASLNTLDDISKEISYQQTLRKKATADNIAGIDAEIKHLEKLQKTLERAAHVPKPVDAISTYKELNEELAYYNEQQEEGDAKERAIIKGKIKELEKLQKTWEDNLFALDKPADVSALNNIEELEEAITHYQTLQNRQSAEEIQNTQKVIQALEEKRDALKRGIDIETERKEISDINALSGKEFRLKVRDIGFDELTKKIKTLRDMLDDTDNPLMESQRKDVEQMIEQYEQWRRKSVDAFSEFKDGWQSIEGIGNGIESITQALERDGDAWSKVCSVVSGFVQIYESLSGVIQIITLLTTLSKGHAAAKTAEAVAVGVTQGATVAESVSQAEAALAAIPLIAANKAATASYMELAAAEIVAAHASIPFAGVGIASGLIGASVAVVEAVAAMPFANGGIVSGPTYALVGEYAGASNNPEVIAPLDKLRSMLQPVGVGGGKVELRARGRSLVGVMANETRIASKSGRRTNIKI